MGAGAVWVMTGGGVRVRVIVGWPTTKFRIRLAPNRSAANVPAPPATHIQLGRRNWILAVTIGDGTGDRAAVG